MSSLEKQQEYLKDIRDSAVVVRYAADTMSGTFAKMEAGLGDIRNSAAAMKTASELMSATFVQLQQGFDAERKAMHRHNVINIICTIFLTLATIAASVVAWQNFKLSERMNFPATRIIGSGGEFFLQNDGNSPDENLVISWALLNLSNKSTLVYSKTSKLDALAPHETLQLPIVLGSLEASKDSLMLIVLTQNLPENNLKYRIYLRNSEAPNWVITTKDLLDPKDWEAVENTVGQLKSKVKDKFITPIN